MRITNLAELPEVLRDRAAAELAKQGASATGKASKYGNRALTIDGERFASRLEYSCHVEQLQRWAAGEILYSVRQVSFPLPGGITYRCDNLNVLAAGGAEVIDAKGVLTKEFVIKAKLMKSRYGIEVLLWTKKGMTPFSKSSRQRKKPRISTVTCGTTGASSRTSSS